MKYAGTNIQELLCDTESVVASANAHKDQIKKLVDSLISKIRSLCLHSDVQYFPDPSGNNDSYYVCSECGLEKKYKESFNIKVEKVNLIPNKFIAIADSNILLFVRMDDKIWIVLWWDGSKWHESSISDNICAVAAWNTTNNMLRDRTYFDDLDSSITRQIFR